MISINFFESFKENIRSVMVHRFSLSKYDIAKSDTNHLFYEQDGRQIFNTSFFTKTTIVAINKIYNNIQNDSFVINGYDKEYTMEKIKNRIESPKPAYQNEVPTKKITIGNKLSKLANNTKSDVGNTIFKRKRK